MIIKNVRLFDGKHFTKNTALVWQGEVIEGMMEHCDEKDAIDGGGRILAPGFLDIHTHGIAGVDCMQSGGLQSIVREMPKHGVSAFCPTSLSETDEAIHAFLRDVRQAKKNDFGAAVLGAYVEGPYLAHKARGAHDLNKLKDPTMDHYDALSDGFQDVIVRMTLAPEREGGFALIERLAKQGVVLSIGHSVATAEQTTKAIDLGARTSTHTFNAMLPLHHREPGMVGVTLTDERIFAEFIADMVHLHPIIVKLIYQAKGVDKCYYCTDSMSATAMPDGTYMLGNETVTVKDAIARIGEVLAGSTLTMDKGLRNLVNIVRLPLEHALQMGTFNPATAMGLTNRGRLEAGCFADMVLLNDDLTVSKTYVQGRLEYAQGE